LLEYYVHTVGIALYLSLQSTVRTAVEGLVGGCYEWQMGKLKLESWVVILREEFEKWVLDLSGNTEGRSYVKTIDSNTQMQMN
jgi:hypothetical protein